MRTRIGIVVALALALAGPARAGDMQLDAFEDLAAWTATASPGASAEIARDAGLDGQAMRIDFDLGLGGFVIVRKPFALTLPANYVLSFDIRGDAPTNNLEVKLVDPRGDDVWWTIQRDFEFPREWERVLVRRSRLEFAWGSSKGQKPLVHLGFLEIAISAGSGGKGSVWIDDLRLESRPTRERPPPPAKVTASTSAEGMPPEHVLDDSFESAWKSGAVSEEQWLEIDLVVPREFGGLIVDWDPEDYATSYRVELSEDGETWTERYRSDTGTGRRSYVYLHDSEALRIRLLLDRSSRGQGYGIRRVGIEPISFSATPNDFFAAIARDAVPGLLPKYFGGEQTYWTVVGVPGDRHEALFNEEGTLEVDKGSFTIEPFIFSDGELLTWRAVDTSQSLERGFVPIPTVTWRHERVHLEITPLAAGARDESVLYARYRVENRAAARQDLLLFLAIRPFQVLPPWQSLNMLGGVTRIESLSAEGRTAVVDGEREVISLTPPERFGAASFEEDLAANYLLHGRVPPRAEVRDAFRYASGAFEYRLALEPGAHAEVVVAAAFHHESVAPLAEIDDPAAFFARERTAVADAWERDLGRVDLELPPDAARIARTVKSTLAYIQINRDGPAIQPGSRTYARSWIRDGAFTVDALLGFGHVEEAREFLRWFAGYQFEDGRIPCCVDRRGAEQVPENDSDGAFVFTLAEYYRYTRDVGFVYELWPAVVRAVDFLAAQRAQRLTDEYEKEDKLAFRGLVPESISHEGYSGHPVHAYWDDFFALRGLRDAVDLAVAVGDREHAEEFAALRDAFRTDLYASLERTMERHQIPYLPGSVELGDFDATSSAAAITPGGELENLSPDAVRATFDTYLAHVRERSSRPPGDEGYTPYELRNVAALILLGRREEAYALLELLLDDRRPEAWNQWAEVVWSEPRTPRFIGDMPHTWVGAGFLRAVRTMFAYERESDRALVLAAGLPAAWILEGPGAGVKRLPTHHGVLSYRLRRDGAAALVFDIAGDLDVPEGGIVLDPPLDAPLVAIEVNGVRREAAASAPVTIREFPAVVRLEWAAAAEPAASPAAPVAEPPSESGAGAVAAPPAATPPPGGE